MKSDNNLYPIIDMVTTGKQIKKYMLRDGYTVKELQKYLCLSCPQPIYRWMSGKVLPSVEHLYKMSRLFHVHMEDILAPNANDITDNKIIIYVEHIIFERTQYIEQIKQYYSRLNEYFGYECSGKVATE